MSDLPSKDSNKTNEAPQISTAPEESITAKSIRDAVENYLAEDASPSFNIHSQRALFSLKEVLDSLRKAKSPKDLEKPLARRLMEQHPNDLRLIKPCGEGYIGMYLEILKEIRNIQESVDEQDQTFLYRVGGKKPIGELIEVLEKELNGEVV